MGIKNYLSQEELTVVNYVSEVCKNLNIKAYLVGGIVRDYLLKQKFKDIDICIESDPLKVIEYMQGKGLIKKFNYYKNFYTSTILFNNGVEIDLICTRKEEYSENGALPTVTPSTIEEDLHRRDFTINALAYDLIDDRLIDLYNGVDAIYRKEIIKIHSNSYYEDPTRIFRAIKYANRYGFSILDRSEIQNVANKCVQNIISHDRIMKELILLCNEKEWIDNLYTLSMYNIIQIDKNKLLSKNSMFDHCDVDHRLANTFYALIDNEYKEIFSSNSVVKKELRTAFKNHSSILNRLDKVMENGVDNYSIYNLLKNLNSIEFLLINYENRYKYIIINYLNNLCNLKINNKTLEITSNQLLNKKSIGKAMKELVKYKLNTLIDIEEIFEKGLIEEMSDAIKNKN